MSEKEEKITQYKIVSNSESTPMTDSQRLDKIIELLQQLIKIQAVTADLLAKLEVINIALTEKRAR
jgi:hypothetical protein